MIFTNNSKIPYYLLFSIYLFFNHFLFNTISIFVLWLIDIFKGYFDCKIWYLWWTDGGLFIALSLLVFVPLVYFKMANNVSQIEIDETNQLLKIWYKTMLFENKKVVLNIDSGNFECWYQKQKQPKSIFFRLFLTSNSNSFVFLYDNKVILSIRDSSGWATQQMDDIALTLAKINNKCIILK